MARKYTYAALCKKGTSDGKTRFARFVTPEDYQNYVGNDNYVLKCPCLRSNGKDRCKATLSFTRSSGVKGESAYRSAYFSANDVSDHDSDCLIGHGGKVRTIPKESKKCLHELELDFSKIPDSKERPPQETKEDFEEMEDSEDLINAVIAEAETCSNEDILSDDVLENPSEDMINAPENKNGEQTGLNSSCLANDNNSKKSASAVVKPTKKRIRTLEAMFKIACTSKAEKADKNGRLICDSVIIKKTNHLMTDGIINHDEGDSIILVADKDGSFSAKYAESIQKKGENLIIFKDHYGYDHDSLLYAIDIGNIKGKYIKSFWEKYKMDSTKKPIYNPKTFIIGAVYKRREEKSLSNSKLKSTIHVLSLCNPKFLILYSTELEKIDINNPTLE